MIRARRPKPNRVPSAHPAKRWCFGLVLLAVAALLPAVVWAQSPLASSYATRDGRAPTTVLGCVATDGSFTSQPCGVSGYPLHVTIDGGLPAGGGVPTTAAGTASSQLVGVQGGGSGALPLAVTDNAVAQVVVQTQLAAAALGTPNDAAAASTGSVVAQLRRIANLLAAAPNSPVNADGGQQVHVMNLPTAQPVTASALPLPAGAATAAAQPALNSDGGAMAHVANFPATQPVTAATLPLPAGAATAALQPALNADAGSQVHVQNFPASQAVTNAGTFAVQDSAVIAGIATVAANTANRSGAWTDASFTATATAGSTSGLGSVTSRVGLHVWNIGSSVACMNYTSPAAVSGSGCAAGSVPIPAGSAYLEDQPGNVSPEAISFVCVGTSCPLTIKVR